MHPEEALVSPLAMALPDSPPGVLVQELADHRLGDSMDYGRVRRGRWHIRAARSGWHVSKTRESVEMFREAALMVNFRRDRRPS